MKLIYIVMLGLMINGGCASINQNKFEVEADIFCENIYGVPLREVVSVSWYETVIRCDHRRDVR